MPATRLINAAGYRRGRPPGSGPRDGDDRVSGVSARGQNGDSQVDELTGYGCGKIFTDTAPGKLAARPELDRVLAYLCEGDVFVITGLSRAMRWLKYLLALADQLHQRGVHLVILNQHIDTTPMRPPGRRAEARMFPPPTANRCFDMARLSARVPAAA